MSRIAETFRRLEEQGKTGLIGYLTVGFPDVEATLELVPVMAETGMDIIELGVPFSDPLADGATVQRASQIALSNGVTLRTCLEVCGRLREKLPLVPLVLMGYYNPILAYGLEAFARDAEAAGADGVIVPDLPPEEAEPLLGVCRSHGIDLIFLVAPTSTDERIQKVSRAASGFVYCVSLTGVTGARTSLSSQLPDFLQRVRRHVSLPLSVGFGVSTKDHVREIGRIAEAVIVGSALVSTVERAEPSHRAQEVRRFVAELSQGADRGATTGPLSPGPFLL